MGKKKKSDFRQGIQPRMLRFQAPPQRYKGLRGELYRCQLMVGSYLTLVLPIARMYTVENVTYVN